MVHEKAELIDTDILGQCVVSDELGQRTEIRTFWQNAPAVLVFIRHFACLTCRAHVNRIWIARPEIESNGARVYFIGNGDPAYIARFRARMNIKDARVFTDPSLLSFKFSGFKRGFLASLGPRAIRNVLKIRAEGEIANLPETGSGDMWQLGGVLVVDQGGAVRYHFISEVAGDYPPESDFID